MGFLDTIKGFYVTEEKDDSKEIRDVNPAQTSNILASTEDAPYVIGSAIGEPCSIVTTAYQKFNNSKLKLFNVENLYANFEGLPEAQKVELIRKNLITFGVDISQLIEEANQRKNSIATIANEFKANSESHGDEISSKIAEAKDLIDRLNAENIERENILQSELSNAKLETARLDAIIKILGGEQK